MDKIIYSDNNYRPNRNKKSGLKTLVLILAFFSLGILVTYGYFKYNPNVVTKTVSETKVTEEAIEEAIGKIYDAVLCIEVLNNNGDTLSTGTGFVYKTDNNYGYILTNSHVVLTGSIVQATLSNGKVVSLTLLGTDVYTDLAVLRIDKKDVLSVASIGTSENIKVGNTVFTVGSPLGLTYAGTVTKGILSGKDRLVETSSSSGNGDSYIIKVLQTDAAISPGNSGGPLVNLAGDVIGITSLKLVNTEVEGMGFAIPIEDAMKYVDILEKGKTIERPVIGVQILDLTNKYLLYRYGINVDTSISSGVILMKVENNYPASISGLKEGDIVTKINGENVSTVSEFKYELFKYNIGDSIEVTYYRNGKEAKTIVKLDKTQ